MDDAMIGRSSLDVPVGEGGCGCLVLLVGAVATLIIVTYGATDPGPPIDSARVLATVAGIMVAYRALGVLRVVRG
jgi:hypothetical protein